MWHFMWIRLGTTAKYAPESSPSDVSHLYCDVFGRMPSLLGNFKLDTPVVARQPKVKHLHGYARDSVLLRCMVALQPWSNGYMDMLTT
jgi:hypothetical protein